MADPNQNQINAVVRGMATRLQQHAQQIADTKKRSEGLLKVAGALAGQMKRLADYIVGNDKIPGVLDPIEWQALARQADRVIPFWYSVDLVLPGAATNAVNGAIQVTQEGYFLAQRMRVSYRPTAGVNAGRYRPVSAAHPALAGGEVVAGAAAADQISFTTEYREGAAQRSRMANPLPGDHFYHGDRDVIFPTPDIWMPASQVTVIVTPLVGPTNAGVATVTFEGLQCLNVRAAS